VAPSLSAYRSTANPTDARSQQMDMASFVHLSITQPKVHCCVLPALVITVYLIEYCFAPFALSDFIESFAEEEMFALRMAQMFPEQEEDDDTSKGETDMPWDYNNEFRCSKLTVYFEVHCHDTNSNSICNQVIHPSCVERFNDQGAAMRFLESSRALRGDEGPEMANVARCMERKHLYHQRKAWINKHGSLWAKPDLCPVMQVHPAATLGAVLRHKSMIVPNFLVTVLVFPTEHPAHDDFLAKQKCIGIVEPQLT